MQDSFSFSRRVVRSVACWKDLARVSDVSTIRNSSSLEVRSVILVSNISSSAALSSHFLSRAKILLYSSSVTVNLLMLVSSMAVTLSNC